MQASTPPAQDTVAQPVPATGGSTIADSETTLASVLPTSTAAAPANDNAQGGSGSTVLDEPPPHPSTKIEAFQLKDPEVRDFGWNSAPKAVPSPLVHGLANDDLYTLVRRFNKVGHPRNRGVMSAAD